MRVVAEVGPLPWSAVPSRIENAGMTRAAMIAAATVAQTPMPVRKLTPRISRPSMAMATVPAANSTARPVVFRAAAALLVA